MFTRNKTATSNKNSPNHSVFKLRIRQFNVYLTHPENQLHRIRPYVSQTYGFSLFDEITGKKTVLYNLTHV